MLNARRDIYLSIHTWPVLGHDRRCENIFIINSGRLTRKPLVLSRVFHECLDPLSSLPRDDERPLVYRVLLEEGLSFQ